MQTSINDLNITLHFFEESLSFNEIKPSDYREHISIPREYLHRYPFIHAHSFLYASDIFSMALSALCEEMSSDNNLKKMQGEFNEKFPMLRKIRNSAQHVEDRIRGIGSNNKKMELKPIKNGYIKSENSSVLMIGNLYGRKLVYTIQDGSIQEFDISWDTLYTIANIFQNIIDILLWKKTPIPMDNFRPSS